MLWCFFCRFDDVLVGAPMYAYRSTAEKWEAGRVYVFYQKENVSLIKKYLCNFTP